MKLALTKLNLALFVFTALAAVLLAEQQPQAVLGKINFAVLFDAAPALPASTVEAGKRTYGTDINLSSSTADLSPFYEPFNNRVAAARNVIKGAVDARPAHREALAQRSIAQANDSAIISRMGGVEKISQMSEAEAQQAAAQAVGSYQQSHSGAPGNSSGMQAMTERLLKDPAYQERFEKMSKKEQEAELQKYMGNANAPVPPAGETAAERRAKQAVNETGAVLAKQNEVAAILQRIQGIDAEFVKKDKAIATGAGSHEQIAQQTRARIAKIPMVEMGEAGPMPDPAKLKAALREQATLDRNRAALELQQRTALYAERKAKYKEVAASYAAWLKQNAGPVNDATAKLLNDATADTALRCEEELINLAENLRKYNEETTRDAAQYEQGYQKRISER
jgi:hypothetical protein